MREVVDRRHAVDCRKKKNFKIYLETWDMVVISTFFPPPPFYLTNSSILISHVDQCNAVLDS